MFKKVSPKVDWPKLERNILKFWKKNKSFEKLVEKNKGNEKWSFLDGPITANNPMGVHHAWGRTLKDLYQRYHGMQGKDERYQNGFDCQGLWVEVEVEKELGFKNKKDIEDYGMAKFVNMCKDRVKKFSAIQTEQSVRLGQWMDWENSYYTMSEENNYAIWHFLKKCHEKGYLYKGIDSVPWCPRCGTAISQHEILTEEYKQVTHKAVFFTPEIIDGELKGAHFMVWTTTPWTVPANVALAVHPDFDYGLYEVKGYKVILLKDLAKKVLGQELEPEKTFSGKDLVGIKYVGPFDDLERVKTAADEKPKTFHTVIDAEDLVTAEEGTGIVHIAPGAGEEDFKLGKEKDLPVIDVINDEAVYLEGMGEFTGKNAKETPELILDYLKTLEDGKYFYKIESYTHRYPTCWRCKDELVWRVVEEWYISMDELRYKMMDVTKKMKWMPEFGLKRELDWLENMSDWLISKKRYWGLALPIYECPECGNFEVIGSREELKEKAVEGWNEFEGNTPHRPWVDSVKIKCSKCGEVVSRIPDVGNPWLDAGIVPFSTIKYFEDKKYWEEWFPFKFISESFPGQFKNWFYSLIAMSTVLEDTNPVERVLGYATVRDEKGEEMHKSKGNAIWFDDAVEKMGADVMRWLYTAQKPEYNLRFGFKIGDEVKRKLMLLWNAYSFFMLYGEVDKWEPENVNEKPGQNNLLDKWIVSITNEFIKNAKNNFDSFKAEKVVEEADEYLDNLTNWYIRRSRRRFWKSENDGDKNDAYKTLYYCLQNFILVVAPIIPFVTEEIYQKLSKGIEGAAESVHHVDFPLANEEMIDEELNKKMSQVREAVTLAHSMRDEAKVKVRQPLGEMLLVAEGINEEMMAILKDEINVKEIKLVDDVKELVEEEVKLNYAVLGKKYREKVKEIAKALNEGYEVEGDKLSVGEFELEGGEFEFSIVSKNPQFLAKKGKSVTVALNVEVSDELKQEGMARDVIRFVQELRKEAGFEVSDRIELYVDGDEKVKSAVEKFGEFVKEEVLATELKFAKAKVAKDPAAEPNSWVSKEIEVEGEKVWIGVKRV